MLTEEALVAADKVHEKQHPAEDSIYRFIDSVQMVFMFLRNNKYYVWRDGVSLFSHQPLT